MTLGTQGNLYAITPQTEIADQLVIPGMFLLSHLRARVLFDSNASHSFVAASCVEELGLKVETLEKPSYVNSPLKTRVSVIRYVRIVSYRFQGFYSLWTLGSWTCQSLMSSSGWIG